MARRTRVKICGITRQQDAQIAQSLGVDALGFVFVPKSARYISPEAAQQIVTSLSAFVTPVGLFLNEEIHQVESVLELMPNMLPQFHGEETPEYCESLGIPYLKAIGVGKAEPDFNSLSRYPSAVGFLFDSNEPGQLGGTGHTFDWTKLKEKTADPLILAGGLNVDNVERAIQQVAPYAVDISSGVESHKGIKDAERMQEFMFKVAKADCASDC